MTLERDATSTSPNTVVLLKAKAIRAGAFGPEQLAREYLAVTAMAGRGTPLLPLDLGTPTPVTIGRPVSPHISRRRRHGDDERVAARAAGMCASRNGDRFCSPSPDRAKAAPTLRRQGSGKVVVLLRRVFRAG
ncbi:hypothetical protein ACGFMK_13630 [Amycolatopsis sp. NPDC049252]|uniref:hypothetical protein n=1 Tax=Amycolatopsis sp. NPDC049252 TaxID=3363933 RepID=UPI00371589B7